MPLQMRKALRKMNRFEDAKWREIWKIKTLKNSIIWYSAILKKNRFTISKFRDTLISRQEIWKAVSVSGITHAKILVSIHALAMPSATTKRMASIGASAYEGMCREVNSIFGTRARQTSIRPFGGVRPAVLYTTGTPTSSVLDTRF